MKRVLAIAPYAYLPYFSGGQKFIAQFLETLGRETMLTVVSVPGNDFSLAKGYRALPLLKNGFSRYYDRSLVRKLSALVQKEQMDSIIIEHPYFAWLGFAVRKRTGVRVYIHTHNIEYQRFRSMGKIWWPVLKWYEKRSFKKADGIFFITPEDRAFAEQEWKISRSDCYDLPFGTTLKENPADRAACRRVLAEKHGITDEKILLFNGLLNYKPNLDALRVICEKINPILLRQSSFRYKILICGKGLPPEWKELEDYRERHILYAGFVEDIETYFKGADLFLNPVQSGGGIKTKMVEAIAFGCTVVSTATGATGIDREVCGEKLQVVEDDDWEGFAAAVIRYAPGNLPTPAAYYEKYNREHAVRQLLSQLAHNSSR